MKRMSVSVVVPVFNSQATLSELVHRVSSVLQPGGAPYEIVLVNDGSRDGSWRVIQGLASEDAAVRGISLARNYGQHNTLLCGIRTARNKLIVTMDDDLQHPPEGIPRLMETSMDGREASSTACGDDSPPR
jgi:glycosyltransferase involved in cell wall biosynthesis